MTTSGARATGRPPLRWEDFLALDEDDGRELIDGRLLEIDVPTKLHEWVVATLVRHLSNWAIPRRAGIVLGSGYKVRIREDRAFMPDVQFFRAGRDLPEGGLTAGAPELAMEVISPTSGRWDRVEKLNGYAAIGVPEYWIVDPVPRTLQRHVLTEDGYRIAESLADEDELAPDSFPGLVVPLAELWEIPAWFASPATGEEREP